jgi:hypothetical protein
MPNHRHRPNAHARCPVCGARSACDMQHATCNMQHATCNMQHLTCNRRHEPREGEEPEDQARSCQAAGYTYDDGQPCQRVV